MVGSPPTGAGERRDKTMLGRMVAVLAVVLGALALAPSARAGEATDVVRQKQTALFDIVAKPKSAARQEALRKLFDEMLDYQRFARDSLGAEWDKLAEEQRARFTALLTDLVRNNYKRNLTKMLDFNIEYVGEAAKNGGTVVQTRAKHKTKTKEPLIEVDFVLNKQGRWQIVDIVTEKASLVKTYRSQFVRILKKDGFEKLVEKMKSKLEQQEKEEA
jgi:phospholipid transport system substrate-binding protein